MVAVMEQRWGAGWVGRSWRSCPGDGEQAGVMGDSVLGTLGRAAGMYQQAGAWGPGWARRVSGECPFWALEDTCALSSSRATMSTPST